MKKVLRFLITAGPTREFIDPVRYISNRSSGKMGYALAAAARRISPKVTLISGPTHLRAPAGVERVSVTTAAEMADAVFAKFGESDVVIMAAAVADYRPRKTAASKIKKHRGALKVELEPTVDILSVLGRRKRNQLLVGFAAETESLEANALAKLRSKKLDMIVANDVTMSGAGFDVDTNQVMIFMRDGRREQTPLVSKKAVARRVIARCLELMEERRD